MTVFKRIVDEKKLLCLTVALFLASIAATLPSVVSLFPVHSSFRGTNSWIYYSLFSFSCWLYCFRAQKLSWTVFMVTGGLLCVVLGVSRLGSEQLFLSIQLLTFVLVSIYLYGLFKRYRQFRIAFILTPVIVSVAILAFQWSNNSHYIQGMGLPLFFGVGVLFAITVSVLTIPFYQKGYSNGILSIVCGFLVSVFLRSNVSTITFLNKAESLIVVWVIAAAIVYLLSANKNKNIYYACLASIVISLTSYYTSTTVDIDKVEEEAFGVALQSEKGSEHARTIQSVNNRLNNIAVSLDEPNVAELPNVYVLGQESTPNLMTLERYGVDTTRLRNLLSEYGFTLYRKSYSVANSTLPSLSATLDMNVNPSMKARMAIGGYSLSNRWLQSIGYETHGVLSWYCTGFYNNYDKRVPEASLIQNSYRDTLRFVSQLANGKFAPMPLTDIAKFDEAKKVSIEQTKKPLFVFSHNLLPSHSNGKALCSEGEMEKYRKQFDEAVLSLEADILRIEKSSPDSVIAVMGDHGAMLLGDCTKSLDSLPTKQVSEEMVYDRFGTLLAVKWPNPAKAKKYDSQLLTNQDFFPVLFAYLYDSSDPLKMLSDQKIEFKGRTFIQSGQFYAP